jgi:hypothetical protein
MELERRLKNRDSTTFTFIDNKHTSSYKMLLGYTVRLSGGWRLLIRPSKSLLIFEAKNNKKIDK